MKKYSFLFSLVIAALAAVGCSKWTETERLTYDNQDVQKLVYLIEAQKESDLNPHMREYYKKLREEYRTKPRVQEVNFPKNKK